MFIFNLYIFLPQWSASLVCAGYLLFRLYLERPWKNYLTDVLGLKYIFFLLGNIISVPRGACISISMFLFRKNMYEIITYVIVDINI